MSETVYAVINTDGSGLPFCSLDCYMTVIKIFRNADLGKMNPSAQFCVHCWVCGCIAMRPDVCWIHGTSGCPEFVWAKSMHALMLHVCLAKLVDVVTDEMIAMAEDQWTSDPWADPDEVARKIVRATLA